MSPVLYFSLLTISVRAPISSIATPAQRYAAHQRAFDDFVRDVLQERCEFARTLVLGFRCSCRWHGVAQFKGALIALPRYPPDAAAALT